ncbi:MAG TPA: hypothetical protein VGG46_15220 [Terriglobales bacterium]|jgi:hypothetical protein
MIAYCERPAPTAKIAEFTVILRSKMHAAKLKCLTSLIIGLSLTAQIAGQTTQNSNTNQTGSSSSPAVRREIVEENPYFRVFRLQITAGAETDLESHGRDAVLIVLGENLALSAQKSGEAASLINGEARFLPMGSISHLTNSGTTTVTALIAEIKQHWASAMHSCSEPAKCTHPIRMGEAMIGETTSLFTNGFVTAYRHRLDPGATLASSYFSTKGKDHLLLIALTDLHANFDGSDEALKVGQTYASEATEIDIDAGGSPAGWIVLRVETLSH